MKQVLWEIKFRVKDKRLYGKQKSILSNVNIAVPTEIAIYVLKGICAEVKRLQR